jgi:hypothetical protein
MPDIQILATKRLRFRNPAVKTSALAAMPGSAVLAKAFFTTTPMVIESAPDWIQNDHLFDWALEAGDIKVVTVEPPKAKRAPKQKPAETVPTPDQDNDQDTDPQE